MKGFWRKDGNLGVLFVKSTPNPVKTFREKDMAPARISVGADVLDGPPVVTPDGKDGLLSCPPHSVQRLYSVKRRTDDLGQALEMG